MTYDIINYVKSIVKIGVNMDLLEKAKFYQEYATKKEIKPFKELIEGLEAKRLDEIIKLILDYDMKSEYNGNS